MCCSFVRSRSLGYIAWMISLLPIYILCHGLPHNFACFSATMFKSSSTHPRSAFSATLALLVAIAIVCLGIARHHRPALANDVLPPQPDVVNAADDPAVHPAAEKAPPDLSDTLLLRISSHGQASETAWGRSARSEDGMAPIPTGFNPKDNSTKNKKFKEKEEKVRQYDSMQLSILLFLLHILISHALKTFYS